VLPPPVAAFTANQGAKETLTIPNVLNVAAAYRVLKPLLVTFTYTFDRWQVYDRDVFVGDNGIKISVLRNYRDGHTLRAGAELDVSPALQVRLGVQRDVSGLRTNTYSPTLPDASSWAGSLGATYKFARGLSLDAGVFYAMMDEVKSTNNAASEPPAPGSTNTLRGTYDISALIYGLSLGWTPAAL
jgi:long-chain fatty acid transport protein